MLPGRLGLRFALEALFLVLLAIGAGLADLRPLLIVLVMAVAWVLVAVVEFTAERIASSPVSYLLPTPAQAEEGEPERVFRTPPEERTVVAPPQPPDQAEPAEAEPEQEPELEPEPVQEQVAEPEPEPEPVQEQVAGPEPEPEPEPEALAGPSRGRFRRLLRRRERELEPTAPSPPRHVKLLPRRSAPQPSRAAQEVAELFGSGEEGDPPKREESGS
jgi:outer membrane biosynthesis protein TonB